MHSGITIARNKGWYGRMRQLRVMVDGADIGRLGAGEERHFDLPAGAQEISGAMDWGRTNALRLADVPPGAGLQFDARFSLNPLKMFALPHLPITLTIRS